MQRNRVASVLRRALRRLLDNSVLRQYVVYWTDLAELAQAAAPDPRIRWATAADEAALTRFGLDCHLVHDVFERGGRIAVLEDAGRIVAANIFWIDPVNIDVLTVRCPPGAVMGSNGFVDPAHRGLRYFAAMKAFAAREFRAQGYRGMVNFARWHNVAANHGHRHAKARPLFRVAILRGPSRLRLIKARNTLSLGRWSTTNPKLIVIP
jgi:hypothetical protein